MFSSSSEFYLDTCNGFLQEIPENFDNGRTSIQLSAISISKNFVAIGSECGALFLYNRNLNRTVKPLRTNECDAVTALELYANEDVNYLAVGRSSGTVIIICMPSEKIRKIRQSIQDEIHRGQAITCVRWSPDGKRLYSSDISGQVIAIDVDFDNELYTCIYVSDKSKPIRDMSCSNEFLIFCTSNEWDLIEAKNIRLSKTEKLADDDNVQIIASTIIEEEEEIAIVFSNGTIRFVNSDKAYNYFDENCNKVSDGKGYYDGIYKNFEEETSSFTVDDFKTAHFVQRNLNQAYFWSSDKLLIIEFPTLLSRCFNFSKLTQNDLFEIVTVTIDSITSEIFILSRDQKVLRLAGDKPIREMLIAKEPQPSAPSSTTYSLVNSFMSAAHQNSSSLFSRLSSIKEFEKLKELRASPRISDLSNRFNEAMTQVATKSAQSAESGTRLANEIFDQIKNSPLTSDFDATAGKAWKPQIIVETDSAEVGNSEEASSPASSESEAEKELIVTRRKKTKINPKRDDLYGISPSQLVKMRSTDEYLKEAEGRLGCGNDVAVDDVEDQTLEAIIRGDFATNLNANIIEEEEAETNGIDKIAPHEEPHVSAIDSESEAHVDEELEVEDTNSIGYKIEADSDEEEEDESLEAAAARSQKLAEKEIEREQEAMEYDKVEDISTMILQLPIEMQPPSYSQISNFANHRSDLWNTFSLPYTAAEFDISSSYIVIIPRKPLIYYPHYRILDVIQNGLRGGGWTPLKYSASQIAVNDQGNLLWRLHKSKAYASNDNDESSPTAHQWHIQADHAKIIQISLTSKHAWYLTQNDICVQMYLPEMGILHQTDCVFRVHSLTASDHAVWALRSDMNTLITRTGIDPQICPMGVDWVEDSLGGPTKFVSIALYDKTGFGIDANGFLWFVNGVDEKNPLGCGCWFQTCYPSILNSSSIKKRAVSHWQLKVSSLGVFFCVGQHLFAAMQPLTGHILKHVIPNRLNLHDNFSMITASSGNNSIFICQPNSEVYQFDIKSQNLSSIPHFDTDVFIMALSAASRRLYILDNSGAIFIRRGFNSEHSPLGQNWEKIDAYQISAQIISIAASSNSLWVVDSEGNIYAANEGLKIGNSPHWTKIDGPKMSSDKIDKIRSSPSGKQVWAFSMASGRGFARSQCDEASEWKGKEWHETPSDIKIAEIAVGENCVWGIEKGTTKVYRLRNFSTSNFIGIGWRLMPFSLRAISIDSLESRLWGLDESNRLVKHEMDIYPRKCLQNNPLKIPADQMRPSRSDSAESWTDVGSNGYSLCKGPGYL